ncbi:hypothetical protein ACQ4LE_001575 [Meloidogyne hapla]
MLESHHHHYSTIDNIGELTDLPKKLITKPKVPRTPIPQTTPTDPQEPLKYPPTLLSPITPDNFENHQIISNRKLKNIKENKNKLNIKNEKCYYCPNGVNCCLQNVQASVVHYFSLSTNINSNL